MKKSKGRPIVAAIGDGANDVSMIQEANVGFGKLLSTFIQEMLTCIQARDSIKSVIKFRKKGTTLNPCVLSTAFSVPHTENANNFVHKFFPNT